MTWTIERLDYYRRELEDMQANGWDFEACQGMLDKIEAEITVLVIADIIKERGE